MAFNPSDLMGGGQKAPETKAAPAAADTGNPLAAPRGPADLNTSLESRWNAAQIESVLSFDDMAQPSKESPAGREKPATDKAGQPPAETGKETAAEAQPKFEMPAQLPEDLGFLKEYGAEIPSPEKTLVSLRERNSQLERENRSLRDRRELSEVSKLTKEQVNEKVEELRGDGKHVEAEELLDNWRKAPKSDQEWAEREMAEANEIFEKYPEGDALGRMYAKPAVASELNALFSGMRMNDKRMPRIVHLAAQGLMLNEVAYKAYLAGRNSISFQPPNPATGTEGKDAAGRTTGSPGRARQTLSSLLPK